MEMLELSSKPQEPRSEIGGMAPPLKSSAVAISLATLATDMDV